MSAVNDPVADFLTRIRNAGMARKRTAEIPHSRLKRDIARILDEEGYIESFSEEGTGVNSRIVIELKYGPDGERAIAGLRRMSRPGRRVYRKQKNIPRVLDGLGVAILSTSRGVMTDHAARRNGIGGEVLCFVY